MLESILGENYFTLFIAVVFPEYIIPEKAFKIVENGKPIMKFALANEDIEDVIKLKRQGLKWTEISDIYGVSPDYLCRRANRLRKSTG